MAQHAVAEEWVTIQVAARLLGLPKETVLRRARRGALQVRAVPTLEGPIWQVNLAGRPGNPWDWVRPMAARRAGA